MAEETTISTPTETVDVDTSTTVGPTDVDTSTVEPTNDVDVAETETQDAEVKTQEPLYAGKYKTVEELEKGYKESQKAFNEVAELRKQIDAMNNAKAQQELQAQQEALKQAQQRGFQSVEQQEINEQVTLAEFDYYWQNKSTVSPESQAVVDSYLREYYNTGNKAYLDEAKRYFDSGVIGDIAVAINQLERQLNNDAKQKAFKLQDENNKKLAEVLKAEYAEFLSDLDNNEGKAEALKAYSNLITSKEDMQVFVELFNRIEANAKEQAIKEYEAQKAIEATKEKAIIDTGLNATNTSEVLPTLEDIQAMTREEYAAAVEKFGRDKILQIN